MQLKSILAFCLCALLLNHNSNAQRQNAVWCFGDSIQMKFDSTISITQNAGPNAMECCSSISDKQGNLLFYAGGVDQGSNKGRIWNSSHLLMQNGDSIALNASSTNGV